MNCSNCGAPLVASKRDCPACFADNGFPNVRLAESSSEVAALQARLDAAGVSMSARHCSAIFEEFGEAIKTSRAVIARSVGLLQNLVESEKRSYVNYQRELMSGARNPEDNLFDGIRTQFEAALFPNFYSDITYGCLTLNDIGVSSYGPCFLVLKESAISARATVFDENPYVFAQRHKVALIEQFKPGYRATWARRHHAAQAKLFPKLNVDTSVKDFPGILISEGPKPEDIDFIEVHIFGSINVHSIEKVVASPPKTRVDRFLLKEVGSKLGKLGIDFKVI